jgi:hypothetical protein
MYIDDILYVCWEDRTVPYVKVNSYIYHPSKVKQNQQNPITFTAMKMAVLMYRLAFHFKSHGILTLYSVYTSTVSISRNFVHYPRSWQLSFTEQ